MWAVLISRPPCTVEREGTTSPSSLPVMISSHPSQERGADQISTATMGTRTMKQLGKQTHAGSPGQDQDCSIFCKPLVTLWVMEIMATN